VLDPAMGSGHFLVEAMDQLARWLVSAWETAKPEEDKQKEVAEQDIHWARREVVRNCIYGWTSTRWLWSWPSSLYG
jgi:hypothetical protein